MILAVATLSFGLCLSVILSYFFGSVKTANYIDRYRFFFHWSTLVGFIIVWAVTTGVFHYKSGQPDTLWKAACSAAENELIPGQDIWTICTASIWVSGCGFTNVGLHVTELILCVGIVPLQALRMRFKHDISKAEQAPMSSYVDYAPPYERKSVDEGWMRVNSQYQPRKGDSHSFDSIRLQVV
ncbi:hypothetical protein Unana1_02948 [Umbelopsis nana]